MIRFSVFYPKVEGAKFDHDYYRDRHIPLCAEVWGLDASQVQVDRGVSGPYEAAVHVTFASMDALQAALGSERTGEVMADVVNYTDVEPVTQISEAG